jgi:hypothetical protein
MSQPSVYISIGKRKEAQIMTSSETQIDKTTSETATLEPENITQKVQITLVGLTPWTVEVNPLEPWDFEPFYQS